MEAERQAVNAPVQGTASDFALQSSILIDQYKDPKFKCKQIYTVHDSIVSEVPQHELELFSELAVQAFTTHVYRYLKETYGIQFSVPLGCSIKIGSHWGEGEEVKYNVENMNG